MKNNFITKFLALFLSGAMLAVVGCKDYDDDIDKINGRLDDLEVTTGKIAPLEQQMSGLQTSLDNLKAAETEIRGLLAGLRNDADANKTAIGKLESTQSQLSTRIDNLNTRLDSYPDADKVQDMIDGTLATYGSLDDIKAAVQLAKDLQDYDTDAKIRNAIAAAQAAAVNAAGEALKEAFKTKTGAIYEAISQEIQDRITAAESVFDGKIETAISQAWTSHSGEIDTKIATAISTATSEFQTQLAAVKKDINAVAGMIQSLVYVPDHIDGKATMNAYEAGTANVANTVELKFRVTPAKLAADLTPEALRLVAEQVDAATRAATAAPSAVITKVTPSASNDGTFTVSAYIKDFPTDPQKSVSLALAANYKAGAEGGSGEVNVENDIMSGYVGIYRGAAKPVTFALFETAAAAAGTQDNPKPFAFDAYEVEWSKDAADSKLTMLGGLDLKASFDGKNYITLADAEKYYGATFAVKAYKVTDVAYSEGTAAKSALKVSATTALKWNTKLVTVEFKKKNTDPGVVGQTVTMKHTLTVSVNGTDVNAVDGKSTTYRITNAKGSALSFGDREKSWTYEFVKAGAGSGTVNPQISFNEVALNGELANVTLEQIMSGTVRTEVKEGDKDVSGSVRVLLTKVSNTGKLVNIALSGYEWGKEYAVKVTCTLANTDYPISGTIRTGKAPQTVAYPFPAENMIYNSRKMEKTVGNWIAVYNAMSTADKACFADAAEFATALFEGTRTNEKTETSYTEKGGKPVILDLANGSKLTLDRTGLKGAIDKRDVKTLGDNFVESAEFTTWYGQKVKVSMTFTLTTAEKYELVAQPAFIKNQEAGAKGAVDAVSEKWAIENVDMSDFFSKNAEPEAGEGLLAINYVRVSQNDKPAGALYPTISGINLAWGSANRTAVEVKAVLTLDALTVDSEPFTVKTKTPIKTFSATAISEKYVPRQQTEVNLLKAISLVDANDGKWIDDKGIPAKTSGKQYTAKEVFGAAGDAKTAGIEFGKPVATYPNGTVANLTFTVNDEGRLVYTATDAELQENITVTVPASFEYRLGKTEPIDVVVTITK